MRSSAPMTLAIVLAACGGRGATRAPMGAGPSLVPSTAPSHVPAKANASPAADLPGAGKVRVHIMGTKQVPEPELRAVVCIDKPGCAPGASNRDVLERDTLLLQAALYDRGYVVSSVAEPQVEAATDGAIDVTFRVEEKDRYRLGTIDVLELDAAKKAVPMLGGDAKVRAMFRSRAGDWFSRATMVEDLGKLRTHYRDAGYALVEADPETEIDPSAHTIRLRIPIKRGPVVTLDHVDVTPATAAQVVGPLTLRYGVTRGARYSETALTSLKADLAKGGVEVDISQTEVKGHPDRVAISIEVR